MTSERSPLLSGQEPAATESIHDNTKQRRWQRAREIALFAWALIATAAVIVVAVWAQHKQQTSPPSKNPAKRNLVFMVSDGMGPASISLTRSFRQYRDDLPIDDVLTLDKHFWGASRTRSSSQLVTDSAAGATAFSCGLKSYNGAISVLPDYKPCGTVLEAAKRAGYMTGLVATTYITDATPAAFASHALLRMMQDDIALQEVGEGVLGRTVDLILGGGRCFFLPNGTAGSCRGDDVDVVALAQEKHNWTYADSRAGFDALKGGQKVDFPFLGLFAEHEFPFELDRRNMKDVYPSLPEMATTALRALEKETADSDQGFFIMIEGSRIDHAAHFNDPAAHVHEILEYDRTFKAVLDFINDTDTETILISTSDHETGGLATALQEPGHLPVYNWYPRVLAQATHSTEFLAAKLQDHIASSGEAAGAEGKLKSWINDNIVREGLGVPDATDEELTGLAQNPSLANPLLCDIISLRAHLGWSTHGHSAIDVNVYSSGGGGVEAIRGNIENIDIGRFMREYLSVDVEEITKELQDKMDLGELEAAGSPEGMEFVASYETQELA